MSRRTNPNAATSVAPELIASGGVFDRHGASVKTEAWSTTSQPVRMTITDATGQHTSAVYLSYQAAEQLIRDLDACCTARRDFEASLNVTGSTS